MCFVSIENNNSVLLERVLFCCFLYLTILDVTFVHNTISLSSSLKGALPLNNDLLGEQASKCRAYAKALHYKEEEFHRGPTTETLEALIR